MRRQAFFSLSISLLLYNMPSQNINSSSLLFYLFLLNCVSKVYKVNSWSVALVNLCFLSFLWSQISIENYCLNFPAFQLSNGEKMFLRLILLQLPKTFISSFFQVPWQGCLLFTLLMKYSCITTGLSVSSTYKRFSWQVLKRRRKCFIRILAIFVFFWSKSVGDFECSVCLYFQ